MARIAEQAAFICVLALATGYFLGRGFTAESVRRDRYGDPLPKGALARLGSPRFRYEGGAKALRFSPDGKVLAAQVGEEILLWDMANGRVKHRLAGAMAARQWSCRRAFDFSRDGKTLKLSDVQGHDTAVRDVAFLPDGKTLISSGDTQPIYFWDATSGQQVGRLPGRASALHISPDGKRLVTLMRGDLDREDPILWDLDRRARIAQLDSAAIFAARFAADGKLLVLAGMRTSDNDPQEEEGLLLIRDGVTGRPLRRFVLPGVKLTAMAQPSDGKTTILASEESIFVVDLDRGKALYVLAGQVEDKFLSFKLSATERVLCGRQVDGRERMWELLSGQEIQVPPGSKRGHGLPSALDLLRRPPKHSNYALCETSSPDGSRLATGLANGSILIWDTASSASNSRPVKPLTEEELRISWADLADSSASKAYRAIDRLTAGPRQAVTLLREHLRVVQPPDPKHIHRLLADLDSPSFAEREQATLLSPA